MIVVSDSSVLIALSRIGRLDILPQLFGQVMIPAAVAAEINAKHQGTEISAPWLQVVNVRNTSLANELMRFGQDRNKLDKGESEAIVLAIEVDAAYLLIDERRGRKTAAHFGLKLIGVLGVLALAKREGLLPEIRAVMDDLVKAGFRISDSLYHLVLEMAGETER